MQALLSLQPAPASTGFVHVLSAGLHTPTPWHWSSAVQTCPDPPPHTPAAEQDSPLVQALPSLQASPLKIGVVQTPVPVLQAPALWHWSIALQLTVEVGVPQTPAVHVSPAVQALLSLQEPLRTGFVHTPVLPLHAPAL